MISFDEFRLNRIPPGLLDFFAIKSVGRNPQRLAPEVRATVELFDMYASGFCDEYQFLTAGNTGAVAAGFTNITSVTGTSDISSRLIGGVVVVPEDEIWYLQEGSTYCTLPAEAAAYGRTLLSTSILGGASEGLASTFNGFDTGSAAAPRSSVTSVSRSTWLRSGRQLFIQHNGTNSVLTIAISARVRIARLRV